MTGKDLLEVIDHYGYFLLEERLVVAPLLGCFSVGAGLERFPDVSEIALDVAEVARIKRHVTVLPSVTR